MALTKQLVIFFFCLIALVAVPAKAEFVDQENDFDDASQDWGWNNTGSLRQIGQSFLAQTETIKGIKVKMGRNSGCPTSPYELRISLWHDDPNTGYQVNAGNEANLTQSECDSLLSSSSYSIIDFRFDTPITVTSTDTYTFMLLSGDYSAGERFEQRIDNGANYFGGALWLNNQTGFVEVPSQDLWFQTYYAETDGTPTNFDVFIYDPPEGQSNNPTAWSLQTFRAFSTLSQTSYPTSTVYWQFQLDIAASSTSSPLLTSDWALTNASYSTDPSVYAQFWKPGYSFDVEGAYQVRARAKIGAYTTDWSAWRQFDVIREDLPIDDVCSSLGFTDLLTFTGFQCFFSNFFRTMFVPDEDSFLTDEWDELQATLATKAPFKTFYDVKTLFDALDYTTSTDLVFDLTLDFNTTGTATTSVPFEFVFMPASGGLRTLFDNVIRPIMVVIIWGLVGFYFYDRRNALFHKD